MSYFSRESAAFAWLGLFLLNLLFVVGYDVWAKVTNHQTLTGELRGWLHEAWQGPITMFVIVGLFTALIYHFFVSR